jgi:two-component system chemotaxis sensor kinase CheA
VATIRGRRVPEVSLAEILGIESGIDEKDRTLIVLRPSGGDLYALSVDRIHDHEELVVKPAAPAVMATGLYAGTTLADDGSPILLFDPAGLAQVGGVKLEHQERSARIAENPAASVSKSTSVLLFKALDGSRRALRLAVVDRIEEVPVAAIKEAAGQLRVQVGEAILPLAGASGAELGDGKVRLFRLNDGAHEIGYAFAEVIDFATIDNDIIHAERPGEISGVSLVNGEPAELVDAHWLFANHVGAAALPNEQLVCRLPSDDPWMQNMLRPIVEAAGYRVVGEEHEGDADLVIAAQGAEVPEESSSRTIWLRAEPDAAGKKDESIYRYDRAGLLMALKTAGAGRGK